MKACVTERFTPRTLDLEVHGSSLVHHVFSLDKELYPTSPRCINGCNGLKHPIQRGVAILLGMLHATETGISFGHLGLWLVCAFTYCRCLNSRDIVVSCPSFSHLAARAPWRACSQATHCLKYDKIISKGSFSRYRLHKRNRGTKQSSSLLRTLLFCCIVFCCCCFKFTISVSVKSLFKL